jgi:hypothetical protein
MGSGPSEGGSGGGAVVLVVPLSSEARLGMTKKDLLLRASSPPL